MLESIEKLLILQDRDKQIRRVRSELSHIGPERQVLKTRTSGAQARLDSAKLRLKTLESRRKDLELEVESRKQMIERYSNQQLQTRKNEEYRALANEIETCRQAIHKLEDQQIEFMEQGEAVMNEAQISTRVLGETKALMDDLLGQLARREENLTGELAGLESNRAELSAAVEESARARYERLVRSKGENVVVGVQHGVCGGCHMRLPAQILVTCQAQQELVACTNCGRILYYTRDMELAAAE